VQTEVATLWSKITDENLFEVSDMAGYKEEFLRLFGFGLEGVDYEADVNPEVNITHLISA
jgi:enoyl-[acyl-carrier protein] reductase/trans-2-enoyl-CoA reductase (NAD+)